MLTVSTTHGRKPVTFNASFAHPHTFKNPPYRAIGTCAFQIRHRNIANDSFVGVILANFRSEPVSRQSITSPQFGLFLMACLWCSCWPVHVSLFSSLSKPVVIYLIQCNIPNWFTLSPGYHFFVWSSALKVKSRFGFYSKRLSKVMGIRTDAGGCYE